MLESQLYGISAGDPVTYVGLLVLLFAAAVLASDIPARRAARVDPAETLKRGLGGHSVEGTRLTT